MRRKNFLFLKSILTFLIMIFCIFKFNQALMVKLSLKDLTIGSDAIIVGEVIKIQSQWSLDKSIILSIATLQIHEIFKGNVNNNQIFIQYAGGEVGDIGLKVTDMPSFQEKEKVLVFLKSIKDLTNIKHSPVVCLGIFPAYSTFGAAQGKYSIDKDGMAQKSGYDLISKHDDRDVFLPLTDLKSRIKSIIRLNMEKRERAREKNKH